MRCVELLNLELRKSGESQGAAACGSVVPALAWSGGELAQPLRYRDLGTLGSGRRRASAPRLTEPRQSAAAKWALQGCKLACNLLSVV